MKTPENRDNSSQQRGFLARLRSDVSGNTLAIVGGAIIPLTAMIGSAVDMSRIYMAKTRLQQACDAGALVGRQVAGDRPITDFNSSDARTQADTYFYSNFADDVKNSAGHVTQTGMYGSTEVGVTYVQDANANVNGVATATLPMTITKVIGQQQKVINVTCNAELNLSNTDIMFVLDTTGSMACNPQGNSCNSGNGSKIVGLRAAAKDFYAELAPTVQTNSQIRYGFVPYSMNVNVGGLLKAADPSWLRHDWTYQTREWQGLVRTATAWGTPVVTVGNATVKNNSANWYATSSAPSGYLAQPVKSNQTQCESATTTPHPASIGPVQVGATAISGLNTVINPTTGVKTETFTQTANFQISDFTYYWVTTGSGKKKTTVCQLYRRDRTYVQSNPITKVYPVSTWSEAPAIGKWIYRNADVNVAAYINTYGTNNTVSTTTGQSGSGTGGQTVNSRWAGCIEERDTVPDSSFSVDPPSGAFDLNIDLIPDSDATRWRPSWPEIEYLRAGDATEAKTPSEANNGTYAKAASECPVPAQRMTEMDSSEFDTYLNSLQARGNTYHDFGMIWGTRLISPTGLFAADNAETNEGLPISRHIIFMTDGELVPVANGYSMYGVEKLDKRITGLAGTNAQFDRHEQRFNAVCDYARQRLGITVWVIGFGTTLSDAMYRCAGDDPNAPAAAIHTFSADNDDELRAHFKRIASNIAALRIGQ
ncbi:MAG: hypothetical protein RIS52_984 [Pseudomonadota bacterium]|jgi:Flp pilus assembly protein TadG